MERLIDYEKSVIPACDISSLKKLEELVVATRNVARIGAYKVGFELVIPFGLKRVMEAVRKYTALPVIYDHQKGGTDIPELGQKFAKAVKNAGADAVILFPFGGAATEIEWIKACRGEGLTVLVGGHMTQKNFLASEGGFINDYSPANIYTIAAENSVRDFVVPGNKPESVLRYRTLLEGILGKNNLGENNFVLYAPGFIKQGGDISETGKAAGEEWHAIIGGAIYNAGDFEAMHKVALELTSKILVA